MAVFDDSLLDDEPRLSSADAYGLVRAAASAGAQVRAAAESAGEAGIERLAGFRPRALVLLTRPGLSAGVSELITALLGPECRVPVVTASALPSWVGALDAVFAHTEDPGDRELAEALATAGRRGAQVVVSAPAEGPVAAAAAGGCLLVPARVPVPAGFSFFRALASGLVMVSALGLAGVELDRLADALDNEAERNRLGAESFVNPAKALAMRLGDRIPLLWSLDPLASAVAVHAASVLAAHGGLVCDVADVAEASMRPALRSAALRSGSAADIFADPDDEVTSMALRLCVVSVLNDERELRHRELARAEFDSADVLEVDDEVDGDAVTRAAVLALRFEMAALYLGLASGALGGPGAHAAVSV